MIQLNVIVSNKNVMPNLNEPRWTEVSTIDMLSKMGLSPIVEEACLESHADVLSVLSSTK